MSYTKDIYIKDIFQGTLLFDIRKCSSKTIEYCKYSSDYSIYGFNHIDNYKYYVIYKTKILEGFTSIESAVIFIINHQKHIVKTMYDNDDQHDNKESKK